MKNKNLTFLIVLLIVVSALPSIAGFLSSNSDLVYSGVVFNPIDGYTYLAKMQIGESGDWLFKLPFTVQPGDGRLLYPFYIAAGQILRILPMPEAVWFNILRLAAYAFLAVMLTKLAQRVFPESGKLQTITCLVLCAGGGMGWLLLFIGQFGADFWVSEAYPFLSGLANPHFPLSLGLMVTAILMISDEWKPIHLLWIGLNGFFLSILSPFGFVLAAVVAGINWLWEVVRKEKKSILPVLIFCIAGLPYSVYQYWAVQSTPQLAAWTAQNQTPLPAIRDILLSFSPWLILLIAGYREIISRRDDPVIRKLTVWVIAGIVLTIIPFNLQRRFLFGLYIPVACLGVITIPYIAKNFRMEMNRLATICTVLSLLTPLFLVTMTIFAPVSHNPLYFYRTDELEAVHWLSEQGESPAVVLASPQTGTLIPSVSRLRVLYGHPFESIDAEKNKQDIEDFYSGKMTIEESMDFLRSNHIDWVFTGPREAESGSPKILDGQVPEKLFDEVSLYRVERIVNHD
jgi:hypothetical protein